MTFEELISVITKIGKLSNKVISEHYIGQKLLAKQKAADAILRWINEGYKHINISGAKTNSNKKYDKLLCFFQAHLANQINYNPDEINPRTGEKGIIINCTIKEHKLIIAFIISKKYSELKGGTMVTEPHNIVVYIPENSVKIIANTIANGYEAYRAIEEYITNIQKVLAHEIKHALQFFSNTNDESDNIELANFNTQLAHRINFFLYFIRHDEIDASFTATFSEYKRQGKFYPNKKDERKVKRKSFIRLLVSDILHRLSLYSLEKRFRNKEINFRDILKRILPHEILLLIWAIFVYGLKKSEVDDLILKGDKANLRQNFNLALIEENMENIKNTFSTFHKNLSKQDLFVKKLNQKIYNDIFSITKSNKKVLDDIKKIL